VSPAAVADDAEAAILSGPPTATAAVAIAAFAVCASGEEGVEMRMRSPSRSGFFDARFNSGGGMGVRVLCSGAGWGGVAGAAPCERVLRVFGARVAPGARASGGWAPAKVARPMGGEDSKA